MTTSPRLALLTLGTALLLALPVGAFAAPVSAPAAAPSSSARATGGGARQPPHTVVLERGRGDLAGPGMGRWRRSIDVLEVTYGTSWDHGTRVFTADYRMRDVTAFRSSGHLQSVALDFGMRRDLPYDHFVSAVIGNDGSFGSTVQRDGEDPYVVTPRHHRVVVLPRRDVLRVEMSTEYFHGATTFDVSSDAETRARGGAANEYVDEVRMSR